MLEQRDISLSYSKQNVARQVKVEVLAGDETFRLIRSVPFLLHLD